MFPGVSQCHLTAAPQAAWLCAICMSSPLVFRSFLRISSHIFFGLPYSTISPTSKYETHSIQLFSSYFFTAAHQFSLSHVVQGKLFHNENENLLSKLLPFTPVTNFIFILLHQSCMQYPKKHSPSMNCNDSSLMSFQTSVCLLLIHTTSKINHITSTKTVCSTNSLLSLPSVSSH